MDLYVISCSFGVKLTKSPFPFGTKTFISEDLELTISTSRDSGLRYIWQPSVLSIDIVGTLPSTWKNTIKIIDHAKDETLTSNYTCLAWQVHFDIVSYNIVKHQFSQIN